MLLYKKVPRFNTFTGKPESPVLESDGYVCDFTGERISDDNAEEEPLYFLSFKYDHGSEPLWYEDHHEFENNFGIDYPEFCDFMNSPYHFRNTEPYGCADVTEFIAITWANALQDKDSVHPLAQCHTFEQVLRYFRIETLRKLLTNKTYTLEELGFSVEVEKDDD